MNDIVVSHPTEFVADKTVGKDRYALVYEPRGVRDKNGRMRFPSDAITILNVLNQKNFHTGKDYYLFEDERNPGLFTRLEDWEEVVSFLHREYPMNDDEYHIKSDPFRRYTLGQDNQ